LPPDEHVLRVAREWADKADNDLKNAEHTLTMGAACPTDTVCFHAQQCLEKYLKALLTLLGSEVPRIHEIAELVERIPAAHRPTLTEDEQDRLTEYATTTRYPGDYEPIPLREARQAVEIARRVRKQIRGILRTRGA
jgi:HEPN domain-containing protein